MKKNLDEVSFIRPILIILLILVHCFTVFNGGWDPFNGYEDCYAYKWLSRTCYSFMLEMFIFISGYVYGYQVLVLHKQGPFWTLVMNKANRLLLPSILFSIIYLLIFQDTSLNKIDGNTIIEILSGIGHLWYLTLLFWCFIALYFIDRAHLTSKIKLIIVLILAILPYPYIPFQLYRLPYYLFFFYIGYYIGEYGAYLKYIIIRKHVVVAWILFAFLFFTLRSLNANITEEINNVSFLYKVFFKIISTFNRLLYSLLGVIALYSSAIIYTKNNSLKPWYIKVGTLTFGIYIFQEFIIKYIYYYTSLPANVGYLVTPWLTFIITLIFSVLLSKTSKSL